MKTLWKDLEKGDVLFRQPKAQFFCVKWFVVLHVSSDFEKITCLAESFSDTLKFYVWNLTDRSFTSNFRILENDEHEEALLGQRHGSVQ